MFYNLYGFDYDAGPSELRQKMQIEILKEYQPDVMAFQEYNTIYRANFTLQLNELGYTEVKGNFQTQPCTPIFYNPEKLSLIDSGFLSYSGANDGSKSVTWAKFQVIGTSKQFVFCSTHFMYNQPGLADPNAVRVSNAKQLVEIIQRIGVDENGNRLPLLAGGDLNCGMTSDPIKILTDSGLLHVWKQDVTKNNSSGLHNYSVYDRENEVYSEWSKPAGTTPGIDHVFCSAGTNVKSILTLLDWYCLLSSDHAPLLVDFSY